MLLGVHASYLLIHVAIGKETRLFAHVILSYILNRCKMARRQSTVLLSNVYAGAEPLEESKTGDPNVICNGKKVFVI